MLEPLSRIFASAWATRLLPCTEVRRFAETTLKLSGSESNLELRRHCLADLHISALHGNKAHAHTQRRLRIENKVSL